MPDATTRPPAAAGPGDTDVPDTPDRNLRRYTGPRPGDGEQTVHQEPTPVPGSPTGAAGHRAPPAPGPARYRKRPVVVEAARWTADTHDDVRAWLGEAWLGDQGAGRLRIETLEGPAPVALGDWIVRGTVGEFWPVRADLFAACYEPADDDEPLGPPPADPGGPQGCR